MSTPDITPPSTPRWFAHPSTAIVVLLLATLLFLLVSNSLQNNRIAEERHRVSQLKQELIEAKQQIAVIREVVATQEYAQAIHAAHRAWERGQLREMVFQLQGTDPNRRGWEWQYLMNRLLSHLAKESCHAIGEACLGKAAAAVSIQAAESTMLVVPDPQQRYPYPAISPDWTRLARVGNRNILVLVCDLATGSERLRLIGHTAAVNAVVFSPDGTRIATASDDRTARIWDAKTGAELLKIEEPGEVSGVVFSPNGSQVLTTRPIVETPTLWDARTGALIRKCNGYHGPHGSWSFGGVGRMPFSLDGRRIVSMHSSRAGLWDLQTGEQLLVLFGSEDESRHEFGILSPTFSPDGKRVVAGCFNHKGQNVAKVWDVSNPPAQPQSDFSVRSDPFEIFHRAELFSLRGHTAAVRGARFSPDGMRIVTAGGDDRTVRVWDAANGVELLTLSGCRNPVHTAAFSLDGTRILAECEFGEVRVWDGRVGPPVAR